MSVPEDRVAASGDQVKLRRGLHHSVLEDRDGAVCMNGSFREEEASSQRRLDEAHPAKSTGEARETLCRGDVA